MGLDLNISFNALLTRDEQAFLADLPDWPTVQKVEVDRRPLVGRLRRLGCIQAERCKDDPIQIWFDVYAGVTFLGRRSAQDGIVRLDARGVPLPDQPRDEPAGGDSSRENLNNPNDGGA